MALYGKDTGYTFLTFLLFLVISAGWVSGEYLGCYEDAGNRLLSDYRMELSEINTPSKCTHICRRLGYQYAGVEYGIHCFCSKQRPSEDKKRSENDCQTPCPNSNEKCGGYWRIAVHSVGSTDQPSGQPTGQSSQLPPNPGAAVKVAGRYHGCYEDSGSRALSDYQVDLSNINSPSRCVYICTRLSYRYTALKNGNQCLCSHLKPSDSLKRSESECQSPCPKGNEKCGGPSRLSVYSVDSYATPAPETAPIPTEIKHERPVVPDKNETYIGCFEDAGNRLLSDFRIQLSEINTPKKCAHLCRALGFPYAGVEYGSHCFCSKQRPNEDKRRNEKDCQSACPQSTEKCGGFWRLSVYSYPLDPTRQTDISDLMYNPVNSDKHERYIGCFEDAGNRLLSDFRIELSEINTPKKCAHVCRVLGFPYAGVEYVSHCFCSKQRPDEDKRRNEKDCQSACPQSTKKCGGFWRLSVYSYPLDPTSDISDETMSQAHLGCFEDYGKLLLSNSPINLNEFNTPKKCLLVCRQLGYKYAGVKNGNVCFCGDEKPGDDKKKTKECESPCNKTNEKCDGFWELSIYRADVFPLLDIRSNSSYS